MNHKKVFIRSFGCQMNAYDAEKMHDILKDNLGYQPTENIEEAELILLNTCSVREKAESKVYDDLGRINILKKANPHILVGVGGCVASQEGEAIIQRTPFVDFVFGPQTLHRLPQMIEAQAKTGKSQVDISFPEIEKFDHLPIPKLSEAQKKVTAFVSIMEGCSKYCTYCVVPYTRGEEFSRPLPDVLTECALLLAQGVKEITLLGQNVNAWRGKDESGADIGFAELLSCVHALPGLLRLRYTTSHPLEFTPALIALYGVLPKLARSLHLPVQSGSDKVLSAMRRGYTAIEYLSIIRALRRVAPDLAITSDFIVGFPGESEKDFQATLDMVEKADFDLSYNFIYSPRPGTPSAALPDDVPKAEKHARHQRLQGLLDIQGKKYSERWQDKTTDILIERTAEKKRHSSTNAKMLMGRTTDNRIVHIEGDDCLIGEMVEVVIEQVFSHSMRGRLR